MTLTVLQPPRKAECLLLELALPGRPAARAGVFLFDAAAGRLGLKLREDWKALAEPEDAELLSRLAEDLSGKIRELGGERVLCLLEDSLSNVLRLGQRQPVVVSDFQRALERLFERHVEEIREAPKLLPFVTHLPLYSLRAAASKFGDDMEVEPEGWVQAPRDVRPGPELFAAHVVGRSMEPKIPDGSLCLFRAHPAGSRQGKLVLVQRFGSSDSGGEFTIKRYRSHKIVGPEGWRHDSIILEPLNPEFEAWELSGNQFRVIAEFLRVLPVDET